MFETSPLSVSWFAIIFSQSQGCLFTLLIVSFVVPKLLSFIRSQLFFFHFQYSGRWVTEDPAVTYVGECFPYVSSRNSIVSGLTFRYLFHFVFISVYGVRKCSSFIRLQVVDQFSQHHLLKRLSFSHWISLPPLSKIRRPQVHGLEESTLSKWPYYPKQSTDSMQSLSSYQRYFSQNQNK